MVCQECGWAVLASLLTGGQNYNASLRVGHFDCADAPPLRPTRPAPSPLERYLEPVKGFERINKCRLKQQSLQSLKSHFPGA